MLDSEQRKMLADALKRYHDCAFTPGVYEHSIVGQAALILEQFVEVVRCEDCKHWHHSGYCKLIGMDHYRSSYDFCSKGERRSNESN